MPKNLQEIPIEASPLFLGYYSNFKFSKQFSPQIYFIGDPSSPFLLRISLLLGQYQYKSLKIITDNKYIPENPTITLNKELMKRFVLIEKAKEKQIFAILINSPTLIQFQETFNRIKTLLKRNNKKFYILMINNLTEAKLGNFPEIEVFVILSCPNHSLYAEKDFYRLIITPYELELALNSEKQWENSIVLDNTLGFKDKLEELHENNEEKKEVFDLVAKNVHDQVQVRDIFQTLDLFQQKTFQGLDLEQVVPVGLAVKGLSGIASSYTDEKEKN